MSGFYTFAGLWVISLANHLVNEINQGLCYVKHIERVNRRNLRAQTISKNMSIDETVSSVHKTFFLNRQWQHTQSAGTLNLLFDSHLSRELYRKVGA